MFFEDANPAPFYTLACAAREILSTLGGKLKINTFLDDVARWKVDVHEVRKKAIRFANFMKHADRDATGVLEDFSDLENDGILFCACIDLGRIAKGLPIEGQVSRLGFLQPISSASVMAAFVGRKKSKPAFDTFPASVLHPVTRCAF